jgi:UDP-N-acetylmuramate--alanine ligase
VLCVDDENVQSILPLVKRRTVTYGRSTQADLVVHDSKCGDFHSTFEIRAAGIELGEFQINVPGEHNVLNATAAAGVALELHIHPERIKQGLAQFRGVDRRFQIKGKERGVTVIDDYGHHPTEIRATLSAARSCAPKRVLVLFQPHRYTRTNLLMDDFGRAFMQADLVFVTDIYAASEKPIPGVTAEALVERMRQFGHKSADYVASLDAGAKAVAEAAEPGDMIITLGAGSISQTGEWILENLRKGSDHAQTS